MLYSATETSVRQVLYQVNKLKHKGATEPSSGGSGFYSNVFGVTKCTGGLWPILSLKWLNHCMLIPTFKMPTIRHVQQLIQCGDCPFSIDLKDDYLHILLLSIIIIFYTLFGKI